MRCRLAMTICLAVLCGAIGLDVRARASSKSVVEVDVPAYFVDFSVREGDPAGSVQQGTVKVVVSRRCRVTVGEKSETFVGSQLKVGDEKVLSGVEIEASIKPLATGDVMVSGAIELSSAGRTQADTVERHSTSLYFERTTKPNQPVRIPMTGSTPGKQWLEFVVYGEGQASRRQQPR